MSGDAGHQQSHPPPAGRVLHAEADGVLPPAVLQPGLRGQGEADPAARPQGGGGFLLPSPGQHVSVSPLTELRGFYDVDVTEINFCYELQ